ncbi:PilZ domain-containing protein [Synechococcus sp. KORDI-52]|uniref:PilZ domain-containing protein n=1 Tax=Synechococcus sp. KORDI-52 TaxID=585425 RepID=UPI0012EBCD34|nr:PilZ domain-containing protein [Synechococcus sp. KORDI-52]
MALDRKLQTNRRNKRFNLAISPIAGLESYFYASSIPEHQSKCVIWNVSKDGSCILLNGVHEALAVGDQCRIECYAPFEKKGYAWNATVRWIHREVFVTFIGVAFDQTDLVRDSFFDSFKQIQ